MITGWGHVIMLSFRMKIVGLFCLLLLMLAVAAQEGEDQQYLQMRRTACVILARMHSNKEKALIEEVIQSLEANDQQKYINKLYAVGVETCEAEITQQEVQSVFLSPFSSTSRVLSSTPLLCSPCSTVWTTGASRTTCPRRRNRTASPASSRSSTRRTRSGTSSARPRRSRRRAWMSVTR